MYFVKDSSQQVVANYMSYQEALDKVMKLGDKSILAQIYVADENGNLILESDYTDQVLSENDSFNDMARDFCGGDEEMARLM